MAGSVRTIYIVAASPLVAHRISKIQAWRRLTPLSNTDACCWPITFYLHFILNPLFLSLCGCPDSSTSWSPTSIIGHYQRWLRSRHRKWFRWRDRGLELALMSANRCTQRHRQPNFERDQPAAPTCSDRQKVAASASGFQRSWATSNGHPLFQRGLWQKCATKELFLAKFAINGHHQAIFSSFLKINGVLILNRINF